jgi:hypothetical protein
VLFELRVARFHDGDVRDRARGRDVEFQLHVPAQTVLERLRRIRGIGTDDRLHTERNLDELDRCRRVFVRQRQYRPSLRLRSRERGVG